MLENKRERGSSILRVLEILDQIAKTDRPLSATEINNLLDLPKATAHRICVQLEEQGYLQRRFDGKRFTPGPKLQSLAVGVLAHSHHRAQRHAILMSLSQDVGETCNIAYPDGSQMAYSDRVETEWPLRLQLPIGTRVPLHCTASGKLYLSSLSKQKRESMAATLGLSKETNNTIISPDQLLRELDLIRKEDAGTDNEEFVEGMIALSVPIKDSQGRFFSAVALHAPVVRMSLEKAQEYIPRLREAADELGRLIED